MFFHCCHGPELLQIIDGRWKQTIFPALNTEPAKGSHDVYSYDTLESNGRSLQSITLFKKKTLSEQIGACNAKHYLHENLPTNKIRI